MPPASCYLLSASCFLLPALRIKLSASCFMHSASSSPLMHRALRSLLPASDFLPPALSASTLYSLRPLLSAVCFLLPASCALCLYPLLFTLYSLLLRSQLSALSHLLSAPCLLIGTLRKMVFREVVSVGVRAAALPHTEKNACGVRPHVAPPRYLSATSLPSLHPG